MVGCADFSEDIQKVDDKLQNEVSDLTDAVSALQVKLAEDYATKVSVESLKAELNGTIAAEVADLEKAIENATAALNAAINEKADQSDLEAVAKTVADLQADLAEAQKALKDELKAAKDELKAADAANAKAIEDLAARLTAAEKAIENINAAVATLQSDVEALKQSYMENTQALTNLKFAYENFVEETTVNFTNVKGNIAALDAYVKSMEETLHERIDDVAKSLTMAINLFTDEIDGLKAEDSAIYVAIQEAQTAITNVNNLLDDEADARETEDAKLYLAIQEANASIGSVYTQLLEAKDELSAEIASQVDVVETAVTSVYNQLLDLQVVVAEINDRLTAQEEAFTEHKAVIDLKAAELRGALDALEPIIATLQAQSAELKATLDALSPVIENINAKIAELKMTLDSLSPVIENLYDRDNELKNTIDSLVPVIDNLNEQVTAMVALQERILSIAYVPETLLDSRGVIDFISMYVWNEVEKEYVYVNSAPTTAIYRVNPTKANLEGVEWAMATRSIKTRAAETPSITIANVAVGQGGAQGRVQFELTADGTLPEKTNSSTLPGTEQVLAALVATTPAGDVIYSDEAYAQQTNVRNYRIINKVIYNTDFDEDGKADKHRRYFPLSVREYAEDYRYDIEMVYNKPINIYDYLETYSSNIPGILPDINVNPTYKVTLVEEFLGWDGETNQQKFVTLAEDGTVSVNSEFLVGGIPAIGRTPLFEVESQVKDVDGNLVTVAKAYVIVKIIADELEPVTVTLNGDFNYTDLLSPDSFWSTEMKPEQGLISLDWETMNQQILDKLSMTNSEFARNYWVSGIAVLDANGKVAEDWTGVEPWYIGYDDRETTTYPSFVVINNLIQENTKGSVVVTYSGEGRPDVIVTYNYSVKHDHVWPAFNPDYTLAETIEDMTVIQVKGKLNAQNTGWVMQSEMKEHFQNYLDGYKDAANHGPLTFFFPIDLSMEDATITGTDWTDQEISLNEPLVGEFKDVLVGMYTKLANGNICEAKYVVRFVNPFVVNAFPVQLMTLIADPDQEDLMDYIKITDVNGTLIYEGMKTNSKIKKNTWYENPYHLDATNVIPTFTCKPDASFGTKLNLSGSLLEWYNGGTDLQQNKTTAYGVEVAISNVSVVEAEAAVTVLSTANSK